MYGHATTPMPSHESILDNQTATLADYLHSRLLDARDFDFVSAYFSIYGYELLEEALRNLEQVRFLFGDPASVDDMDPGEREPKSFDLSENGLKPNHSLQQKYLAKRCAEWFSRKIERTDGLCASLGELMDKVPLPGLVAVRAGGLSWAGRPSGVTTPVKTVLPPSDPDPS